MRLYNATMTFLRFSKRTLLVLLLLSGSAAASEPDIAGLVIFGDSLSDTGNKHLDTGLANTPPYDLLDDFLVPDGPYTRGGLHHSNGQTWVEQWAKPLGLNRDVKPVLRGSGGSQNYAYGGARARDAIATSPNTHLPEQITNFLADVNEGVPEEPLYVIFIGGNDVADAVQALAFDPSGATSVGVIIDALTSVSTSIQRLYADPIAGGARKFLVFNSPDIGLTPAFNPPVNNVPNAALVGSCFSLLYNLGGDTTMYPFPFDLFCSGFGFPPQIPGFNAVIDSLEAGLPGTDFTRVDSYAVFHEIVQNPQQFGLNNVTNACVTPNEPPFACKKPNSYLFWDGIHPTKKVHQVIAEIVAELTDS